MCSLEEAFLLWALRSPGPLSTKLRGWKAKTPQEFIWNNIERSHSYSLPPRSLGICVLATSTAARYWAPIESMDVLLPAHLTLHSGISQLGL